MQHIVASTPDQLVSLEDDCALDTNKRFMDAVALIKKMEQHLSIYRTLMPNMDDEELQWQCDSRQQNSFIVAEERLEQTEHEYGKVAADLDRYFNLVRLVKNHPALRALKAKRGEKAGDVLRAAIDGLQAARYVEIAEKNPSQEAFAWGWLASRIGALA